VRNSGAKGTIYFEESATSPINLKSQGYDLGWVAKTAAKVDG
jgi:hypothetical protein